MLAHAFDVVFPAFFEVASFCQNKTLALHPGVKTHTWAPTTGTHDSHILQLNLPEELRRHIHKHEQVILDLWNQRHHRLPPPLVPHVAYAPDPVPVPLRDVRLVEPTSHGVVPRPSRVHVGRQWLSSRDTDCRRGVC